MSLWLKFLNIGMARPDIAPIEPLLLKCGGPRLIPLNILVQTNVFWNLKENVINWLSQDVGNLNTENPRVTAIVSLYASSNCRCDAKVVCKRRPHNLPYLFLIGCTLQIEDGGTLYVKPNTHFVFTAKCVQWNITATTKTQRIKNI